LSIEKKDKKAKTFQLRLLYNFPSKNIKRVESLPLFHEQFQYRGVHVGFIISTTSNINSCVKAWHTNFWYYMFS